MTARSAKIDAFMDRATRWQEEMRELRDILLDCDLTEELKWGKPCYTAGGGNIVIIQPFKAHLSLMFFKGALLKDSEGILRAQGENTQSALRIEFTGLEQVTELESTVKSYIEEAIAVEEAGLEAPKKKVTEHEIPEFVKRLRDDEEYREAFDALTPGRKRSYLLHFSGAKRAEMRECCTAGRAAWRSGGEAGRRGRSSAGRGCGRGRVAAPLPGGHHTTCGRGLSPSLASTSCSRFSRTN